MIGHESCTAHLEHSMLNCPRCKNIVDQIRTRKGGLGAAWVRAELIRKLLKKKNP